MVPHMATWLHTWFHIHSFTHGSGTKHPASPTTTCYVPCQSELYFSVFSQTLQPSVAKMENEAERGNEPRKHADMTGFSPLRRASKSEVFSFHDPMAYRWVILKDG